MDRIIIFNFIPTGRGKEITSLDISPVERENLLQLLYQELTHKEIQVICTAPQFSRVCMEQSFRRKKGIYSPTHFATQGFDGKAKELVYFLGGCGGWKTLLRNTTQWFGYALRFHADRCGRPEKK